MLVKIIIKDRNTADEKMLFCLAKMKFLVLLKNFSTINRVILEGAEEAYRAHSLPYTKIAFPQVDERALGAWMQTEMLATLYLAQLMGVNAFDQPNVEEYKAATRMRLAS